MRVENASYTPWGVVALGFHDAGCRVKPQIKSDFKGYNLHLHGHRFLLPYVSWYLAANSPPVEYVTYIPYLYGSFH